MTAEEEKTIRTLQSLVQQLIFRYQQLKDDNEELLEELVNKDSELQAAKQKRQQIEADYTHLKMARMLEVSDTDVAAAKQRINHLVRNVDKCIALLKAMGNEQ